MQRSLLLDVLRITAISLVFVAHVGQLLGNRAGQFFGLKNFYYVSWGGVGVTMFLLLSGILLGFSPPKTASYWQYILQKLRRIYPMYLMSVPLAMLGYVTSNWALKGELPALFPNGFAIELIGSVSGFYSWLGLWGGPYNPPSWFIGLIITLYALTPALVIAFKKKPHLTLAIIFSISVLSRWYVGHSGVLPFNDNLFDTIEGWAYRQWGLMPGRPTDWFPPCRLFEFSFGIYLALLLPRQTWFVLDKHLAGKTVSKFITLLSNIAFPLFLVHYPFIFLVTLFQRWELPTWLAIGLYLILMIWLAWLLTQTENRLQQLKNVLKGCF